MDFINLYRFHCTLTATKGMLDKMAEICHSSAEDMTIFYITLKLHLFVLNAYVRKSGNNQAENVAKFVTDIKVCIIKCIQKPSFGYGERFVGKNSKAEIEVS